MSALARSILLFSLNFLDAQLTLVWIRADAATEGNALMAHLLNLGDAYFLIVKILVGAFAAYVLYRFSRHKLARRGMTLVLGLYLILMGVHAATAMSALGWQTPEQLIAFVSNLPDHLLALFS